MRRIILTIIIISLVGIGFFVAKGLFFDKDKAAEQEPKAPPVQVTEPKQQSSDKEPSPKPVQSQMEFTPEQKMDDSSEKFDESITRKKRVIKITPGVAFEPGRGVNMRVPGSEESIQIRRDNTYRAGEYRVQWEKKF